mgnify:CR=1 FL=1
MRLTFYSPQKALIATKDEPVSYKEALYEAVSQKSELLLDGAYYRVRGLRVALPVDNPPEIAVTLEWLRRDAIMDDYC